MPVCHDVHAEGGGKFGGVSCLSTLFSRDRTQVICQAFVESTFSCCVCFHIYILLIFPFLRWFHEMVSRLVLKKTPDSSTFVFHVLGFDLVYLLFK